MTRQHVSQTISTVILMSLTCSILVSCTKGTASDSKTAYLVYQVDTDRAFADWKVAMARGPQQRRPTPMEALNSMPFDPSALGLCPRGDHSPLCANNTAAHKHKDDALNESRRNRRRAELAQMRESEVRRQTVAGAILSTRQKLYSYLGRHIGVFKSPEQDAFWIELKGRDVANLNAIKRHIMAPGSVEFLLVDDTTPLRPEAVRAARRDPQIAVEEYLYDGLQLNMVKYQTFASEDRRALARFVKRFHKELRLPEGRKLLLGDDLDDTAEKRIYRTYLAHSDPILTTKHVRLARTASDERTQRPEVVVELTEEGARLFGAATKRYVGRRIAIVANGRVVAATVVQMPIIGGRPAITMGYARDPRILMLRVKNLVAELNYCIFPVRLRLIRSDLK